MKKCVLILFLIILIQLPQCLTIPKQKTQNQLIQEKLKNKKIVHANLKATNKQSNHTIGVDPFVEDPDNNYDDDLEAQIENLQDYMISQQSSVVKNVDHNISLKEIFDPQEVYFTTPFSETNTTVHPNSACAIFKIDLESIDQPQAVQAVLFQLTQIFNLIVYGRNIEGINKEIQKLKIFVEAYWEGAEDGGEAVAEVGGDYAGETYSQFLLVDLNEFDFITGENVMWLDDFKEGMDLFYQSLVNS